MHTGSGLMLFWGKARPVPEAKNLWHPVAWHGLDVAAAGLVLLHRKPALAKHLSPLLGLDQRRICSLVTAVLALHDIGKLTRPFQAKVPACWPTSVLGPPPVDPPADPGHGAAGMKLMMALRKRGELDLFPEWPSSEVEAFLDLFLGHHGRPVAEQGRSINATDLALFGRERVVLDVAADLIKMVRTLLLLDPLASPPRGWEAATWPLAGLAALADWIGSRQEWFPYAAADIAPETYWREHALPQAERAVTEAGIAPAPPRLFESFADLVGGGRSPSPLQAWAERVGLPDGPILVIVEDVTGSGKTEAAMVLAHRLMAAGRAAGLVMALPTMATANAMFARLGPLYRRLFADGARPSLALAHGAAALSPDFQAAVRIPAAVRPDNAERRGDESTAECAAWLADDRRKAFLADVGVATIDQAILAVLPAKHQPVRLLGLAERVLVVDEAHAYDAYVTAELEALLSAHAGNGGSAIVLSATLPARIRQKLATAFATGLGRPPPSLSATSYPMATLVGGAVVTETPLSVRPDLARSVRVERLADGDAALAAIAAAASHGAAVAWVRNTVDDAFDAAARLRAAELSPLLFHARFAMGDRLAVEAEVLRRFGPAAPDDARRQVLVATQVIEQSLDLDFDLVVTDLAPVDLLLQRMGRLWRHPARHRPPTFDGPRLLVVAPEPVDMPPRDWVSGLLPGTSYVYPEHALLWRSARAILDRGLVRVPDDVRALVESVYRDDAEVPAALAGAADRVRGKASAQTWVARTNTLDLTKGYAAGSGNWAAEHMIPTRDAEDYLTLRLGRLDGGRIVPWCADADPRRAWALSEVKVRRSRATGALAPAGVAAALIEKTRSTWPEYERAMPLLVLIEGHDRTWHGHLERASALVETIYRRDEGLRFTAASI